jgi:hypothetical protein
MKCFITGHEKGDLLIQVRDGSKGGGGGAPGARLP